MSTLLTFNGKTLNDISTDLRWTGASAIYSTQLPVHTQISRGSRMGVYMPEEGTVAAGALEIEVMIQPPLSGHSAIRDALRDHMQGAMEIEFDDLSGRVLYGVLESDQSSMFDEASGQVESEARRVHSLRFTLPTAIWFDKYVRWMAIPATTATAIADLGPRAAWFELIVPGPASDVSIEYQLPSGHPVATLSTTGAVATGEYLRIVMSTERVYLGSGGSETAVMSWLDSTGTGFGSFFALDPGDGVPLLKTSHAGILKYRRTYAT